MNKIIRKLMNQNSNQSPKNEKDNIKKNLFRPRK